MSFSINDVRLGGWLIEPASPQSFQTVFQDRPVPQQVDLRAYCSAVENQGQIGSCTANAAVGALEYHYLRRDGRSPELSRLFVYYNARRLRGSLQQDTGATIPEAMAALLAYGACREELWPYNPMLFAAEPPPHAYQDGKQHEAVHYARVNGIQGVIHALADGFPVAFGTYLPARCYQEAASTGLMPEPTEAERNATPQGGHAMLIVGYDQHAQHVIVRNSWGEHWGDGGYCKIPFQLITRFSPPDQFWIVAELERSDTHFTLLRPQRETTATAPSAMAQTATRLRDEIRAGLNADLNQSARKIDQLLSRRLRSDTQPAGAFTAACYMCSGSGRCYHCNGTGSYIPGTTCSSCQGSGQCAPCWGNGQV
ncbi:MAG: hypothetical protein KDK04_12130 [Candidatus Competibacteraceae bacterium]|nr:hypothetical protein [Candidatus Competibacteraceae bacterium]